MARRLDNGHDIGAVRTVASHRAAEYVHRMAGLRKKGGEGPGSSESEA
jgi:hypothetical protein